MLYRLFHLFSVFHCKIQVCHLLRSIRFFRPYRRDIILVALKGNFDITGRRRNICPFFIFLIISFPSQQSNIKIG